MACSALDAFPGIVADAVTGRGAFHTLVVQSRGGGAGSFAVGISGKCTQLIVVRFPYIFFFPIFGTQDKPSSTEGIPRAASGIERHL
jgi:hypothetical protein